MVMTTIKLPKGKEFVDISRKLSGLAGKKSQAGSFAFWHGTDLLNVSVSQESYGSPCLLVGTSSVSFARSTGKDSSVLSHARNNAATEPTFCSQINWLRDDVIMGSLGQPYRNFRTMRAHRIHVTRSCVKGWSASSSFLQDTFFTSERNSE